MVASLLLPPFYSFSYYWVYVPRLLCFYLNKTLLDFGSWIMIFECFWMWSHFCAIIVHSGYSILVGRLINELHN